MSETQPATFAGKPVVGSLWVNAAGEVYTVTGMVESLIDELSHAVVFSDEKLLAWWLPLALWQRDMRPASSGDVRPTHLAPGEPW